MERLTEDYNDSYCLKKCHPNNDCFCDGGGCPIDNCREVIEALNKLGEYEKAEEQGVLVRLPCKVGDTVWDIDTGYPEPYKITAFSYGCHDLVGFGCDDDITFYYTSRRRQTAGAFLLSEIGKTVFLTCEEAEKKLKEM
uniref:Uncharacterized protein n=1 Tax=Siphoviridae sp. ctGfF74 TaxID=2826223 RepID=A0A8S5NLR7_9CAUD|nr:MAG TPA: hypothetical protein [Siphoviridae sp. ctGfF74]